MALLEWSFDMVGSCVDFKMQLTKVEMGKQPHNTPAHLLPRGPWPLESRVGE